MPLVPHSAVSDARAVIAGRLHRTPLVHSRTLSEMTGLDVYLKLEAFQKTGSFKVRGVLNRLATLTREERASGVVTLSAGNHAQALAWAAGAEGMPAVVVMPATAVRSKVEATRGYGAEVIQTAGDLLATAHEVRDARGLTLVHPFDDPRIIAGAATATDEIFDDLPDADAVIFGVGGGGLGSGVLVAGRARRPEARLIGVEPEGACVMRMSLDAGRALRPDAPPRTIADGLAAPFAGAITFEHFRDLKAEVVTVPDAAIVDAMWRIIERTKILAEPAAAAGLAALLAGAVRPALAPGARVVLMISGGNVDRDRLKAIA
jgi:threonine dehydratase